MEHLAQVNFDDVNEGLNPKSPECIKHVEPYYLATCHDGHEGISPCDASEPADNTLRSDTWLKQNVPLILESKEYKE